MRGFQKQHTETITFQRGGETLSLTVAPPPLLWGLMLDAVWPAEADTNSMYYVSVNLVTAAEGLRAGGEEGIPPNPGWGGDATAADWRAYAETVRATFHEAGLTAPQIVRLASATRALSSDAHEAEEEALGKPSAPGGGSSPLSES